MTNNQSRLGFKTWFVIGFWSLGLVVVGFLLRDLFPRKEAAAKIVTIKNRNLSFQVATHASTVGEMLEEQSYWNHNPSLPPLTLRGGVPPRRVRGGEGELIFHGSVVGILQPISITINDAGNTRQIQTTAETVGDLLNSEKIGLAVSDQVQPPLESYLGHNMNIIIDRIADLEVTEVKDIAYSIKLEHDSDVYYGREEIVKVGVLGSKEQKFLVTYKNGVEVARRLLQEVILEPAQAEIRIFGTKIEIETSQEGRASWYAYKGCACAAHPFYGLGRYLRVTAIATGKSVIVKINDRGPDQSIHPDRVVDLDVTAYRFLASPSSGTIPVKVELLR